MRMTESAFTGEGLFITDISVYISNGYCDGSISIGCFRHGNRIGCPETGSFFGGGSVDAVKLEVVLCGEAVYTIFIWE